MKKGRSFFSGLVIILLLAGLITGALVAGYRFVTYLNKDVDEKFKEVAKEVDDTAQEKLGIDVSSLFDETEKEDFVYSDRTTRTYSGKKLYEKYGYIYNDSGEVLDVFFDETNYGLLMRFDVDRKYGVFVKDRQCYLVTAELNYRMIADDCNSASICYEGTYVCLEMENGIYLYDIENDEKILVASEGLNACVSPDGRTVFYEKPLYNYTANTELYVTGIGRDTVLVDSNDRYSDPRAVSNDANTLYYTMNNQKDISVLYCQHNGVKNKVTEDRLDGSCYFDRDFKTVLIIYDKKAVYYNPEKDRVKKLIEDERIYPVDIFGSNCEYNLLPSDVIIDTDCLSDAIMLKTEKAIYCLDGYTPKTVKLSDYSKEAMTAMTERGPVSVARFDYELIKTSYIEGQIVSRLIKSGMYTDNYVLKNNFTMGWYCERVLFDGEMHNFVAEFMPYTENSNGHIRPPEFSNLAPIEVENVEAIIWDNMFGELYLAADRNLYSLDSSDGTTTLLLSECRHNDYSYRGPYDPVEFYDTENNTYIVIGDKLYECGIR